MFRYAVTKDEDVTLLAEARQVMVYVDLAQRAAVRVPVVFRRLVEPFEGLASSFGAST